MTRGDTPPPTQQTSPAHTTEGEERVRQFMEALNACDAAAVQDWRGRRYTPALGEELLRRTGAETLRPVRPGEAVAMDFRSDRLTVELDRADRIVALRCD